MSHSNYQLWVHVIWTTKGRQDYFTSDLLYQHIKPLLYKIGDENRIKVCILNGYKDHIHCLIQLKSNQNIAECVKILKGISSRRINEMNLFDFVFEWQVGYYAYSVSPNRLQTVINYIKNQWSRHEKIGVSTELEHFNKVLKY